MFMSPFTKHAFWVYSRKYEQYYARIMLFTLISFADGIINLFLIIHFRKSFRILGMISLLREGKKTYTRKTLRRQSYRI